MDNNDLSTLINNLDYYNAYDIFIKLSYQQKQNQMVSIACYSDNIKIIGFMSFVLQKSPSYENHSVMLLVLKQMCWIKGAYDVALFHAMEMHRISPTITSKLDLLFFWTIPEKLISDDFALKLAEEILTEDPSCIMAKKIFNQIYKNT